jgi:hypothetical protein
VDVDPGVGAGQPALGAGQLDPGHDLLGRGVPAQPDVCGVAPRGIGKLVDPGLELGQRALERVEALALDARIGPDGEGPGGYERSLASAYLRWSIGT